MGVLLAIFGLVVGGLVIGGLEFDGLVDWSSMDLRPTLVYVVSMRLLFVSAFVLMIGDVPSPKNKLGNHPTKL